MESGREQYELIDAYVKGTLPAGERAAFNERMEKDAHFRLQVEEHARLIDALKLYGERSALRDVLDDAHADAEKPVIPMPQKSTSSARLLKKYWPLTAVAASLAIFTLVGTFYKTNSLEVRQKNDYRELRRTVDNIRRSQKMLQDDINEVKVKEKGLPGNYTGTGFLISPNGYLVTSYHVVKEADSVLIENERFGRLKTSILFSDAASDISVLKVESDTVDFGATLPYTLNRGEAALAEEVYTLGFPREDVVFGEGSISALTGYDQTPIAYQVSVPVNPGNSGGPLLNAKGDLVGIISGNQMETAGAAFAIKSTVLLQVLDNASLDTLEVPLTLSRQNTFKTSPRVQQVKRWKDYVFMVRVYKADLK